MIGIGLFPMQVEGGGRRRSVGLRSESPGLVESPSSVRRGGAWETRSHGDSPRFAARTSPWGGGALLVLAILPLLHSAAAPVQGSKDEPTSPDVLVVLIDDLSDRDLDEAVAMPVLAGLAETGLRFRRAYAHPVCSPSRYALLHGRYSFRGGFGDVLRPDDGPGFLGAPTLPQSLKAAGYATACVGKWHLSRHSDVAAVARDVLDAGFDTWRAGVPYGVDSYLRWTSVRAARDGEGEVAVEETLETAYCTDLQTDALIEWWRATPAPRFAYLPYQALHGPFEHVPRSILAIDEPDTEGMTPRDKNRAIKEARWRAMAKRLDEGLGRLLEAVDLERTLVFVMGDNGTAPGTGVYPPGRSKPKVYEGGIRVPFLVAGPGVLQRGDTDALASLVDVAATVWEATGVARPEGTGEDGVSLWPVLARGEPVRELVYTQRFRPNRKASEAEAVISARGLKLLRLGDGTEEAYDVGADPLEERPLEPLDRHLEPLRELLDRLGG